MPEYRTANTYSETGRNRATTIEANDAAHILAEVDRKHCNLHDSFLRLRLGRDYITGKRGGHSINFPARLEEIAREKGVDAKHIEIWFTDEARIGQKNKITRRWAKRGTRPSAPFDRRTASA